MYGGMHLGSLVAAIFVLGFAFIVYTSANKEQGNVKLAGQIISAILVLIAIVVLLGLSGGGMMNGQMMR
jgi:hypothetical protein